MMSVRIRFVGLILLLAPASLSCGISTADFCEKWADEVCQGMAECCDPGTTLNVEDCRPNVLSACALILPRASSIDEDAARACIGTFSSCRFLGASPGDVLAQRKTCATVGSGLTNVGSLCANDSDCASAGDFGFCWHGVRDELPNPRCTAVHVDEQTCAYDPVNDTLSLCPDDAFCAIPGFQRAGTPPPAGSPWSAACRPRIAEGKSCIDPDDDDGLLPCAAGLYCHVVGSFAAACEPLKPLGAPCDENFGPDPCEGSFTCEPFGGGGERRCAMPEPMAIFCDTPPVCGDHLCSQEEIGHCAEDCGLCGDGVCGAMESATSCPEDCGPGASCFTCACKSLIAEGGCQDLCDGAFKSSGTADFCNGAPALPDCAACIASTCGGDPTKCTD